MSVLRVKNERLEKLCRALHKGGKVTANDVEQVTINADFFLNWSFSRSSSSPSPLSSVALWHKELISRSLYPVFGTELFL